MNHTAYIFGDFGLGYTQYPDDFTKDIYKGIVEGAKVNTQIAIYRDGNLVYYIYHRHIKTYDSKGGYMGISLSFNNVYCNNVKLFFSIFEDTVTNLLVSGKILEFADDGEVCAKGVRLFQTKAEIERITSTLTSIVQKIPDAAFLKLPSVNYGISQNETIHQPWTVTPSVIDRNMEAYNLILISKNTDYDSEELSGYAGRIKNFNQRVNKLTKDNAELLAELVKVRRQKKRTTIVTVLFLLIAAVVIVFISVGTNLSEQVRGLKSEIDVLKKDIEEKREVMANQLSTIQIITDEKQQLKRDLNATKNELQKDSIRIDSLLSHKRVLEGQLTSIKNDLSSKESEISRLKRDLSNSEYDRDNYKKWYGENIRRW